MNLVTIITRGFVVSLWCRCLCFEGLDKGNLTFQRYVIIDAKRQQTGSIKVKTDFHEGTFKPRA